MDIGKLAAYANVGSFVLGCGLLYLAYHPAGAEPSGDPVPVNISPLMWLFLSGLVLAAVLHLMAALVARPSKPMMAVAPRATDLGMPPPAANLPGQPTTAGIPQPSFDAKTVLPDGRTIISCSLEDLQSTFSNGTVDQFNRLLGGKWVKISGQMEQNLGNGHVYLLTQDSPHCSLVFEKGWAEQLSVLPRGSTLTVRGKVQPCEFGCIDLVECELL